MPYPMFSRLLRCRLIAEGDGYAASLALLTQMESKAADWFEDERLDGEVRRTIYLAMLQSLASWNKHLAPEQTTERKWCQEQFDRIKRESFEVSNTIFRLDPAIPFVAKNGDRASEQPNSSH